MPSWLIPALKAVLPHIGTIVDAAKPVFTRKKPAGTTAAPTGDVTQQQIAELQAAAAQNAEHVHELAEQLQSTVAALQTSAALAESRLRRVTVTVSIALAVSCAAMLVALVAYLRL
jgi:DNA-directed RNA polymerase sigma subunit (sigma70/sigma32)